MNRRRFLRSLLVLGASPAIVRASSLMSVVPIPQPIIEHIKIEKLMGVRRGRVIVHMEQLEDGSVGEVTVGDIEWFDEAAAYRWVPASRGLLGMLIPNEPKLITDQQPELVAHAGAAPALTV